MGRQAGGEAVGAGGEAAPQIGIGRLVVGDAFAPLQERLVAAAPRFGYRANSLQRPRHSVVSADHLRTLRRQWSPLPGADTAESVAAKTREVAMYAGNLAIGDALEVSGSARMRYTGVGRAGYGRKGFRLEAIVVPNDATVLEQLTDEQRALYVVVGMPRSEQAPKLEKLARIGLVVPLVGIKVAADGQGDVQGLLGSAFVQDIPDSFTLAPFDAIDESPQRL